MFELVRLLLATPRWLPPQPAAPPPREPAPPPAAPGRTPLPASAPPPRLRQALLAPGPSPPPELATPPPLGPARDRAPLASQGLAPVLALAVRLPFGATTPDQRGPRADRHHGDREPALGHRADPRSAPQARHRRQRAFHPPLPPPGSGAR